MCGESSDHLLLHCDVSKVLWDEVLAKLGIACVMSKRVVYLLACWTGIQGNCHIAAVWKIVPLCLRWCIWNERMDAVLIIKSKRWQGLMISFVTLCCFGLRLLLWMGLVLMIFLLFFPFSV